MTRTSDVEIRTAPIAREFASAPDRAESFARALDALRAEVERAVGADDAAYIQRVGRVSRALEVMGRGLVHFSFEPATFALGTGALWLHKVLELMEIGHSAMHGAYDRLPGAEAYAAENFRWKAPIDERGWHNLHNLRHHQYTNIAGRDPDLDFGGLRLSAFIPYRVVHRLQPWSNFATWFVFAPAINLHATGVLEYYFDKRDGTVLRDRGTRAVQAAHRSAFGKFARYYAREYVLFPMLAGPFFWKVLLANVLTESARDFWAAAIIYCGHVGTAEYAPGTRAKGRAAWYAMQVEAASNVSVPRWTSILCGALDLQIEHHLFPKLPPNRLRDIAPRVRAVCEAHGVRYRSAGWGERLREITGRLRQLAARHEPQ